MVLSLPGAVLHLGRNLDMPLPAPGANAELAALLARYEPVPPAPDDCGATDWAELVQRMHFISHLFRAFHERRELASAPFTPAQVERSEGRRGAGRRAVNATSATSPPPARG